MQEVSDPSSIFLPEGFEPPVRLTDARFVLEPIGPQHADRDYAAWTTSLPEICAQPGFEDHGTVATPFDSDFTELIQYTRDFAERRGFTYTVLDPNYDDVIGCVYIYPGEPGIWLSRKRWDGRITAGAHARVKSWVRWDRQELQEPLNQAVASWLRAWPFESVQYMGRSDLSR